MIDAGSDLHAILDDCGGPAQTTNGDLLGRFLEEPVDVTTSSGHTVLSSEPVFYSDRAEIERLKLVRGSWIDVDGARWHVKEIPRADTSGFVRITLSK